MAGVVGGLEQTIIMRHTAHWWWWNHHFIFVAFIRPLFYLSSLRNLPCSCFLFVRLLFLSGFIDVPLPGDHCFDGLLDWPAVDLLVLEQQYCKGTGGEKKTVRKQQKRMVGDGPTFSEKVLYGRSIGCVFAFSSSASPYDQLFWIWKHNTDIYHIISWYCKKYLVKIND